MKMFKFFASVLVSSFLLVGSVSAIEKAESSVVKAAESSLKNQVSELVSSISTQETGSVFVYFNISAEKGFEVLTVIGENTDLVNAVKKALKTEKFAVDATMSGRYKVRVRFADKFDNLYLADN